MTPKRLAILLGTAIVVFIVLADLGLLGPLGWIYAFPYGDKVGHFALFGLLSLFANLAAFEKWPRLDRTALALRVSLLLAVLIGLEESSQKLFPLRTFSLRDLAAGYLGVALFALLALYIAHRRHRQTTGPS